MTVLDNHHFFGMLEMMSPMKILLLGALLLPTYFCIAIWKRKHRLGMRRQTLDFSKVQPLPEFKPEDTSPYPYRPWTAGKYNMTMGLRKMPADEWLIIDSLYKEEQVLRRHLLKTNRQGVMQCLPTAEKACEEALECIVNFLIERYPSQFKLLTNRPGFIYNGITARNFKITKPYEQHPLEVAAQLVMEDINLLLQGAGNDQLDYCLCASFSMAPAGWYLQERIGWPIWRIHGPVPLWEEKLRKAMQKYAPVKCKLFRQTDRTRFFLGLKIESPVQRNNYFIQMDKTMFQQEPFPAASLHQLQVEDVHIRHERQTLRRLPRSGAVMFMVRTYLTPLTILKEEKQNLFALRNAVSAWPAEMAKYKGRHAWGEVLSEFCGTVLKNYISEGSIE
ncbi:hypothetical protein LSUE1_G010083 [Lachnellula suecica]|uniref:DUF3445 domain-containing protein n=1 Tax=Lachnellula suecica TaxID=602035 RepID=A0A8T9BZA0_9HELO|nr:hypothetical protein LSUE1_G010083 [Lachnellula suecica]